MPSQLLEECVRLQQSGAPSLDSGLVHERLSTAGNSGDEAPRMFCQGSREREQFSASAREVLQVFVGSHIGVLLLGRGCVQGALGLQAATRWQ